MLGACTTRTPTAAPLPSPSAAASEPGATQTAASPDTPTPVPPTATPAPRAVGYVAEGAGTPGVLDALQRAAGEAGWTVETSADGTEAGLRALAESGALAIVADGAGLQAAARAAAAEFPETYFVGVHHAGGDPLPNLLTLGGAESREDQLGFMAGAVAGMLTEGQIVTAVADTASAAGLKYRNGFLHGVRYTCTRCRVDFVDVADENATAIAAEQARMNASLSSDVVFAAAFPAGLAGLQAAAQQGAWVIGAGADMYAEAFESGATPGAERLVTSVFFDAGGQVYQALSALQAGSPPGGAQPFDAANGAIGLAPYQVPEDDLSQLDRLDIDAILARLASGALDTGVDPLTGQVR